MQLDATIANGIGYVQVDTSKKYQTIEGFGGAFTEASAKTWMRLPVHERKRVIDLYFGEEWCGLHAREGPHEFLRLLCII